MPIHIHLHDKKTRDYGTSEGAKKAAATRGHGGGGMNSPEAHARRAALRQKGENKAGYKASMARQGKPEFRQARQAAKPAPKPQFQQALSRTVKNIKAERPKPKEDTDKQYMARLTRLARDDSVSKFFDSAGLAPPLSKKEESKPDTDLSSVSASKKEGEFRSGPFDNLVHSKDGGPGSGPRPGGGGGGSGGGGGGSSGQGTPSKKADLQRQLRQAGIHHSDISIQSHNGPDREGTHVDHREHMDSRQDALMRKLIKEHGDHALHGDKGIIFAHK